MRITFHGAAQTVTGSMHLLEVNGTRILLDCGLFQGPRREAFIRNSTLPFDARSIDFVILSHAHIDHSGNLPTLARHGYRGDILCTAATRDLCGAMLRDSAHIQESDARTVNKFQKRSGERAVQPLYTMQDAEAALGLFVGVSYGHPQIVAPGVTATFRDAGHILGAGVTLLDIVEGERRYRFAFTGDLGRRNLPIIRDPEVVTDIDWLITESTYGDRFHGSIDDTREELQRIIVETARRGGKVIIPAFAVERTQEIVFALHILAEQKLIPDIPVYVDSPLALEATEVFRLHPEDFDEETNAHLRDSGDPFGFKRLRYIRTVEESKQLNSLRMPAVIISASGMCESGRILHHLKNNIEDERNTILLVSWQSPHTLGRRLLDEEKTVSIYGQKYTRRARIEQIPGFSAHADRNDLNWWIGQARGSLKGVFVVHGETPAASTLRDDLLKLGIPRVEIPAPGQIVEI